MLSNSYNQGGDSKLPTHCKVRKAYCTGIKRQGKEYTVLLPKVVGVGYNLVGEASEQGSGGVRLKQAFVGGLLLYTLHVYQAEKGGYFAGSRTLAAR